MKLYRTIDEIEPDLQDRETVLTIGTFDGVHRGHRMVLEACLGAARSSNRRSMVITFAQHPLSLLRPVEAPLLLTTPERKLELLTAIGLDAIVFLDFTPELAMIEAEDFTNDLLFARCGATVIICGHDFKFGRYGRGSPDTISSLGLQKGVHVVPIPPFTDTGQPVSSTRIREALRDGQIEYANEMLGRPYDMDGRVVAGFRRGRAMSFPTANLVVSPSLCVPAQGVYAVRARTPGGETRDGMINIGVAPTFGLGESRLEAHLFDFSGDLYGSVMRVEFHKRLREERTFESAEALERQLHLDKQAAVAALRA